jgi:hypothetical protein
LPFIPLSVDVTRLAWFALDVVLAIWVFRRLGLGPHWIAFPPMFAAIVLGHIEVVVLALLVLRGPLAGLAAFIKPYAVLPLIAERNWRALIVGAAVLLATAPFLPWPRFLQEAPLINATLARQDVGDSAFGDPVLMAIAVVALAALGPRRALWLGVPVLWPHAQPIYKVMSIPALTPVLAIAWALPIQGATLMGVVILAVLVTLDRVRPLPGWLRLGIHDVATKAPSASVDIRSTVAPVRVSA